DLLQLERDEQDAPPLVALLNEPAVDELDRADVEPSRGLRGDQDARVACDLAREHDLLLVASREASRPRLRPTAPHVVGLDQLRRALEQATGEEPAEPRVRWTAEIVEGDVLGVGEI